MTISTITRGAALVASRLVAFVAGAICVGCAGAILFEDVAMHGAPIELKHLLTAGILSIAVLVGHLRAEAWRQRHYVAAAGFFLLFVVATALVVYQSTGKQAEATFASQAEADLAAEERARIKPLLTKAEAMLSETMDRLQADCVNGRKGKGHCDGLRTTRDVYEAAVKGHRADLERLGPAKPVVPEAESFADAAAALGADKGKVKATAVLAAPFIRTMLFEYGGIWCLGFAFRPFPERRETGKPAATRETVAAEPAFDASVQTDFATVDIAEAQRLGIGGEPRAVAHWATEAPAKSTGNWGNPGNGGGRRVYSKAEALLDLTRRLASGETVAAQNDLADAWGVDKSTVAKWLKRWRRDGLAPAAQRVGRCHRLVAAAE